MVLPSQLLVDDFGNNLPVATGQSSSNFGISHPFSTKLLLDVAKGQSNGIIIDRVYLDTLPTKVGLDGWLPAVLRVGIDDGQFVVLDFHLVLLLFLILVMSRFSLQS